jgi:hypothetical protein
VAIVVISARVPIAPASWYAPERIIPVVVCRFVLDVPDTPVAVPGHSSVADAPNATP